MKLTRKQIAALEAGRKPEPSEDDVQRVIVDGLRLHGYSVRVTSRRRKRCRECGQWSAGGDGVDRGVGDLIVRRRTWRPGLAVVVEVKPPGPVKWSSPEQKAAAESGETVVVQSLEEALEALAKVEG